MLKIMRGNMIDTIIELMQKFWDFLVFKVIIAFCIAYFANITEPLSVFIAFLVIDTLTGSIVAKKCKRFNSTGFKHGMYKIMGYFTVIGIFRVFESTFISPEFNKVTMFAVAFLSIGELISIVENLQLLGVPLPKGIIDLLLKQIKLKSITSIFNENKTGKESVLEIDRMIKYQVANLNDECLRVMLAIKFNIWRDFLERLWAIETSMKDNRTLRFEVLSMFRISMKDTKIGWTKAGIPSGVISNFNIAHSKKVDEFVGIIERYRCGEKDKITTKEYLTAINNSLIRLLYQTILDAQEEMYNT